jgi:hypothetical protein
MPQIVLMIRNDDGTTTERTFELAGDLDSLDGIDEAVEQFKSAALPEVEQHLLTRSQEKTIEQEKKTIPEVQRD